MANVVETQFESVPVKPVPLIDQIPAIYLATGLIFLIMPFLVNEFILFQIISWALLLGMIALSFMLLAGYGGMISLMQMTIAGVAGYMVAILGDSAMTEISQGWSWFVAIPLALVITCLFATFFGWLAVRTEGIYTIMITLSISAAFFYFARQNYDIFNGWSGFNSVLPPIIFGINFKDPIPNYYLCLFWASLSYFFILYLSRSPFGLALQGIRDNHRRMSALGFNVVAHRVFAYTVSAIIAGIGGIILVWQTGQISPGSVSISTAIDILIIAVVGGIAHPIGAFIGALIFVVLKTFAIDVLLLFGLSGDRFQLLIGLGFLLIVYYSPDGILGLWQKLLKFYRHRSLADEKVS